MPGENAECTCLALRNLFEWLGGVPERIVFDNAAGVGHKGYGEREPRLTHLFQAFQAHYGFDCSFCNPYSGHEKGAVESKVGMVRRKLFVPRPSVWSLENFSAGLPDRCLELATKPHYRKDTEERGLFSEDRAALLPLPGKRVFCQVGVGRFGVSFSPCERRVSGRFGVGRSCWLLVIALVIA